MFRNYCKRLYTQYGEDATHLLMDGGKLKVEDKELPKFLNEYIKCVNAGEDIALVEKLGKRCMMKFFIDVDKVEENNVRCDKIVEAANEIIRKEPNIYKCTHGKGLHIVYNMVVHMEDAIEYCKRIKGMLEEPEKSSIDESVYKTGLRMVGSKKYVNNEMCNRCYMPLGHMKGEVMNMNMLKPSIVRVKSIETEYKRSGSTNTEGIQSVLKKIDKEYENIKMTKKVKFGEYICISTMSKYCTNIGKEHKNNKVYFVIDPDQNIYQKCFCKCDTTEGRKYGRCSEYKSKKVRVPNNVYKQINAFS